MAMRECDLIMKGGITSGVVYPGAIHAIAETYRLRSIGGSSAGAIAAAFAAAAEYRRQRNGGMRGFEQIRTAGEELANGLEALFQPAPALRPLFQLLQAVISKEARSGHLVRALLRAVVKAFWPYWLGGVLLAAIGLAWGAVAEGVWFAILALVCGLLLAVGSVLGRAIWLVFKELPRHDFGLCSGLGEKGLRFQGERKLALCEWIADRIDEIAGNLDADGKPGKPLTIGELKDCKIEIAAMTTDLSSGRPYQLPLKTKVHYFSRAEFERLFPQRIVDYLCEVGVERQPMVEDPPDLPRDLHQLPYGGDFPVLLVARMSLSFPGLIRAVPLWRVDYGLKRLEFAPMRRCLFSDGGISSNFPIHFFDSPLPSRPTFGIALESFDCLRHTRTGTAEEKERQRAKAAAARDRCRRAADEDGCKSEAKGEPWPETKDEPCKEEFGRSTPCGDQCCIEERVHLPTRRSSNVAGLPIRDIDGIGGFLFAILNTAKDWQDRLQSLLLGYAERIVRIRLRDEAEGGLNLNMSKCTIQQLLDYGTEAGGRIVAEFDMTQHRFDRALVTLPAMAKALARYADGYEASPEDKDGGTPTYEWVLTEFDSSRYGGKRLEAWRKGPLPDLAQKLATLGADMRAFDDGQKSIRDGGPTGVDADFRLVASADRVPHDAEPKAGGGSSGSAGTDGAAPAEA